MRTTAAIASIILSMLMATAHAADATAGRVSVNIESQPVRAALKVLSDQAKVQVLLRVDNISVDAVMASRVSGEFTLRDALNRLLANTGLTYEFVGERAIRVTRVKADNRSSANLVQDDVILTADARAPNAPLKESGTGKADDVEEMLVEGEREKRAPFSDRNVDLPRTIDDAQAYYVFSAETIQRSGAVDISEFLKNRLTMASNAFLNRQKPVTSGLTGNVSSVNLRGLSSDQTLILINGRRMATVNNAQPYGGQTDLNSIPTSAIDRIEVLPSSASGIYGGGALGGVINVILKRDYQGGEVNASYGNVFDADAPNRNIGFNWSTRLEGGRSGVTLTASYNDMMPLKFRDRAEIFQRSIDRLLQNAPDKLFTLYSPFLGSTTNIVSFPPGANLTLKGSGLSLAASSASIPAGYRGVNTDNGAGLIRGQHNLDFPDTVQSPTGLLSPLGSPGESYFLAGNLRRKMTDSLDVFLEYSYRTNDSNSQVAPLPYFFHLPASAVGNPFNQDVRINVPYSWTEEYMQQSVGKDATLGVDWRFSKNWQMRADYTWSRMVSEQSGYGSSDAAITDAVNSGQLNVFVDTLAYPLDLSPYLGNRTGTRQGSENQEATLRVAGSLNGWPFGRPRMAVNITHLTSDWMEGFLDTGPGGLYYFPPRSQTNTAFYAELQLPLVNTERAWPFVKELELQLSGRHDRYEVDNAERNLLMTPGGPIPAYRTDTSEYSSDSPTVGLRYKPIEGLMLRAAYTGGFRTPAFDHMLPAVPPFFNVSIRDPKRPGDTNYLVQRVAGGNPDLQPERSKTRSWGVVFEPAALEGLRLTLDNTRIEKANSFLLPSHLVVLANEDSLPGRVTRAALTPGDPFAVGRVTRINASYLNAAWQDVDAYDVTAGYKWSLDGLGSMEVNGRATWLTHLRMQYAPNGPLYEQVDMPGADAMKFKGNADVVWELRNWIVGWVTRYTPSYAIDESYFQVQGGERVSSQIQHDVYGQYRFAAGGKGAPWYRQAMDRSEVRLGIKNVFDREPPFDASNQEYFYSYYGDTRLREYTLSLRKQF